LFEREPNRPNLRIDMKRRDPYFPILLMLVLLLTAWLGIAGPLFRDVNLQQFWSTIKGWQTLIAALIALGAAYVAWSNTTRQLSHAAELERKRRSRKQAALRAVMPLAFSEIVNYARRSSNMLQNLRARREARRVGDTEDTVTAGELTELPADTIAVITEFIEYSDTIDVALFENMLSRIQIHNSRTQSLITERGPAGRPRYSGRHNIEEYMIDSALIYASASAVFGYARRETDRLPTEITWDDVRNALGNFGFHRDGFENLFDTIDRRERRGATPFRRRSQDD
jgi:hypothetical protein